MIGSDLFVACQKLCKHKGAKGVQGGTFNEIDPDAFFAPAEGFNRILILTGLCIFGPIATGRRRETFCADDCRHRLAFCQVLDASNARAMSRLFTANSITVSVEMDTVARITAPHGRCTSSARSGAISEGYAPRRTGSL